MTNFEVAAIKGIVMQGASATGATQESASKASGTVSPEPGRRRRTLRDALAERATTDGVVVGEGLERVRAISVSVAPAREPARGERKAAMSASVPLLPPRSLPVPLSRFLAWLEGRATSPHTRRAYEQDLRGFAAWYLRHSGEGWEGVPNATALCLAQYVG